MVSHPQALPAPTAAHVTALPRPRRRASGRVPTLYDAGGVSAANCDRGGDRLSIEPSDEQLDVWVGCERRRDQSLRKLGSKSAFSKDADEFIQTRLDDRDDAYARTQYGGIGYWMQNHAWVEGRGRLKPVAGRNVGKARSELLGHPHRKGTSCAATHATEVASSADSASRVTTHPLKPDRGRPVLNEKIEPSSCVSPW